MDKFIYISVNQNNPLYLIWMSNCTYSYWFKIRPLSYFEKSVLRLILSKFVVGSKQPNLILFLQSISLILTENSVHFIKVCREGRRYSVFEPVNQTNITGKVLHIYNFVVQNMEFIYIKNIVTIQLRIFFSIRIVRNNKLE